MYVDISIDLGNKAAKGAIRGRTTVIRNLAVRDDGSSDNLKDLGLSLSGNGGGPKQQEAGDSATIWFDNNLWVVGEAAWLRNVYAKEKTGYERYGSAEQMVVWLGTLSVLLSGKPASLGMSFSMPVSQIQHGRREEIISNFYGEWTIGINESWVTYEVIPEMAEVVPEGFGSLAYLCLDQAGKKIIDRHLPQSRVLVFDLGGYTLDIGAFENWGLGTFYKSFTTGLVDIRNKVNDEIKNRFNRGDVPGPILEQIIATGCADHKGKKYDVKDIVERATGDLISQVESIWVEQLGHGADYNTVIMSGGGGPAVGPLLAPIFDHADFRTIPTGEAHIANALGILRYRRFRTLAQEAALKQQG